MLPTLDLAAKVSEQRIAPMLRDCANLARPGERRAAGAARQLDAREISFQVAR
jgi:hypothetical protein